MSECNVRRYPLNSTVPGIYDACSIIQTKFELDSCVMTLGVYNHHA